MMSYMSQSEDKAPPLSPLPKVKPHPPQSPLRKVSDHHTVFIRPLKMTPSDEVMFNPQSPHKPLCYSFSRSPAKVSNKKVDGLGTIFYPIGWFFPFFIYMVEWSLHNKQLHFLLIPKNWKTEILFHFSITEPCRFLFEAMVFIKNGNYIVPSPSTALV